MSPNDMIPYRERFNAAAAKLGWSVKTVEVQHERDWDCSWEDQVWLSADGIRLFSENDLEQGMVQEIIRIAALLPQEK